jgi:two-component system LytT family sensor kinase
MISSLKEITSREVYRLVFHILILTLLLFIPVLLMPADSENFQRKVLIDRFIVRWATTGMVITPIYLINVYYFISRFLIPGKYVVYALVLIGGVILTVWLNTYVNVLISSPELTFSAIRGPEGGSSTRIILFPLIMSLALGTSFEMIINWEIQRREKAQIEREKMAAELSFLKSQMNPHFLFNSLNNIYSLAERRSDKTGEAVLMLSSLLRYMLYGSNNGKTQLSKEIECIENYIAIQKLRIPAREDITIGLTINTGDLNSRIEPLILLPFVENAFKHGISNNQRSEVLIDIDINKHELDLIVRNTKKQKSDLNNSVVTESGIGLRNIKRRLELLYPERHELSIKDDKDYFEVNLRIVL